jgi:hypothetical protein
VQSSRMAIALATGDVAANRDFHVTTSASPPPPNPTRTSACATGTTRAKKTLH